MRKRHKIDIALLLVAVSASGSEAATVVETPDTATTHLTGVTVEGTRDADGMKSSAPVHTLDAGRMLSTGVTDIGDAMRRMPGVNLRDYGGTGGMKTVSVRGLGSQHIGVVYDGVSLGDIQGGQIDLSRYSLDNLSSISLTVGDADDIYMPARAVSSASSVVISSLKSPDMHQPGPEYKVSLRAGSFGMWNPAARFAASNGRNLGMSANADFIHARNDYPFTLFNGEGTSRERRVNSQINSGHAELNGIWKPNAASSLQAKFYWFDNSRHLPGPVIYYNNESNERLRERNVFGQLSYGTRLSSKVSVKGLFKYNWASSHYTDSDGRYPGGFLDQRYTQREEYGSASVLYLPFAGFSASYAADFWHNSLSSNLKSNRRPLRNSFLQCVALKYSVWRLSVVARGLWSIIHDRSEGADGGKTSDRFSPSVGFTVRPLEGEQWRLRASYKNVMRMPTFNELYFDHYGTVNLNPEIAEQFNIGTTWSRRLASWLPEFGLTADFYLNNVKNKIVAMPYNMFVWTMTNLGRVRVLGIDATLNADFRLTSAHHLEVSGNYSYQRAAPRTDPAMHDWMKQLAYTPLNSGAWSLTWKNPWVNLVVHGSGCSARYPSSLNVEGTRIPGYMEVGLTLYRDIRLRHCALELRADMTNLLDKQYEIIARYPMPGRAWALSVAIRH